METLRDFSLNPNLAHHEILLAQYLLLAEVEQKASEHESEATILPEAAADNLGQPEPGAERGRHEPGPVPGVGGQLPLPRDPGPRGHTGAPQA